MGRVGTVKGGDANLHHLLHHPLGVPGVLSLGTKAKGALRQAQDERMIVTGLLKLGS